VEHEFKIKLKQQLFIKIILASFALLLISVDIFLAYSQRDGAITFSRLFKSNEGKLIWFTFTFGCLVGKVYYNRYTVVPKKERTGLVTIILTTLTLLLIGQLGFAKNLSNIVELIIFIAGLMAAHYLWPQYERKIPSKK
jgi:hypothetical protein